MGWATEVPILIRADFVVSDTMFKPTPEATTELSI